MNRTVNRYANGHRRRTVRAQVMAEEDNCHICGLPVDKELPPYLPGSPTVDELIPVSKGGSPYDRSNTALAHFGCNVRRGNGTRQRPLVVPFVTSRRW
jgi:5-methylcytosine-specific restriction endonuclease McrA